MSLLFRHPFKKLTLAAAFAGGYVLGTKAGRERYEQIVDAANQVKADPRVQQATAQATEFAHTAADKVKDDPRVKDVVDKVESVTKQATDKLDDVKEQAADKVDDVKEQAADKVDDVKEQAADKVDEIKDSAGDAADSTDGTERTDVHPLLADEHVVVEEEVVYSSGPDIEEPIADLAGDDKPKHL